MTLKKIESYFSSPLFLTLAILMTVNCVFSFNILSILMAIGMWIAYAAASKGLLSEKQTGIKMISGTVKALKILTWIGFAFTLIAAIICFAMVPVVNNNLGDESLADILSLKAEGEYDYIPLDGEPANGAYEGDISDILADFEGADDISSFVDSIVNSDGKTGDSAVSEDSIEKFFSGIADGSSITDIIGSIVDSGKGGLDAESVGDILSSVIGNKIGNVKISDIVGLVGNDNVEQFVDVLFGDGISSVADGVIEFLDSVKIAAIVNTILIFLGVIFAIGAIWLLIYNLTFVCKVHRFTKSVCRSFETGEANLAPVTAVKVWSIIFGVIYGLDVISAALIAAATLSVWSLISSASLAALYIIGFVLMIQVDRDIKNPVAEQPAFVPAFRSEEAPVAYVPTQNDTAGTVVNEAPAVSDFAENEAAKNENSDGDNSSEN